MHLQLESNSSLSVDGKIIIIMALPRGKIVKMTFRTALRGLTRKFRVMPLPVRKSTYGAQFVRNLLAKFVKAPGDKSHNFETAETKKTEFFGFLIFCSSFKHLLIYHSFYQKI